MRSTQNYYVYIASNIHHTVLYVGMTNDIVRRMDEHRAAENKGFASRYNVRKLLYYERFSRVEDAIAWEKTVKRRSRRLKVRLILLMNPGWSDLYHQLN